MIRVRELAAIARKLDGFAFAKQMGPFVLMQKSAAAPRTPSGADWQTSTSRQPSASTKKDPAAVEFADQLVATLPPPAADGSLQLIIGRSPDCDVVVDDPAVSSKHAAILWDGRSGVLRELGSSNGTFLNGLKLGSKAALRSGDQLAFGDSHFVYLLTSAMHARLLKLK